MKCAIYIYQDRYWLESWTDWEEYNKYYTRPKQSQNTVKTVDIKTELFDSIVSYIFAPSAQKLLREMYLDA